jgi:hypothetical protein
MQRARTAGMVTAEHYAYVKNDLRVIGMLAVGMFLVIVIFYFYLRSLGQV